MLPFRPLLQGIPDPETVEEVASSLGIEDEVKDVCEEGSRLCTIENDQERNRVFAETMQWRHPDPCGDGKEGQLESTQTEH